MRDRSRAAGGWLAWLLAASSLGCLAAAANWASIARRFDGAGSQDLSLVLDARDRMDVWLFWAAVAAAGAVTVWLVGRALGDRRPGDDRAPDGVEPAPLTASSPSPRPTVGVLRRSPPPAAGVDWDRPVAPRPVHGLDRARWLLALGWVALLVTALLAGARPAPYEQLLGEVEAGRVTEVSVAGRLRPGDGTAIQEVTWRAGWTQRRSEVVWVEDGVTTDGRPVDAPPVLRDDVGLVLLGAAPGLVVERADRAAGVSSTFLGWHLPFPWLSTAVLLLGGLLTVVLIVNLPPPWRLTRWAWFWLGLTPVGVVLFALLAGPTPGLPGPRNPERRLRGWAAFALSVVLSPFLHWGGR